MFQIMSSTRRLRQISGKCIYTIQDTLDHIQSHKNTHCPEGCSQERWAAMIKHIVRNGDELQNPS